MKKYVLAIALALVLVLAGFFGPTLLKQLSAPAVVAQAPSTQTQSTGSTLSSASDADLIASLESAVESVYENVSPSVVFIEVTQGVSQTSGSSRSRQMPQFQLPPRQGSGSGFVWDKQGNIVTNNHVVANATSIKVTFSDGTTVPAQVVGTDSNSDLAVIRVSVSADKLHPVTLADSTQVKVGQIAIAIGNPFGLESTMTVGFVSGLQRTLSTSSSGRSSYAIPDIIQTDAPINPGNSGGVLLNRSGQVIGVTSAIASSTGTSSGVGFAVPAATVAKVVPALIGDGHYASSWLGISGGSLNSDLAEAMDLKSDQRGVLIGEVVTGGPADKAGLKGGDRTITLDGQDVQVGGDVIVAIDGHSVSNFEAFVAYLANSTTPGQKVTLTILRSGREQQVTVTLGERPTQSEE